MTPVKSLIISVILFQLIGCYEKPVEQEKASQQINRAPAAASAPTSAPMPPPLNAVKPSDFENGLPDSKKTNIGLETKNPSASTAEIRKPNKVIANGKAYVMSKPKRIELPVIEEVVPVSEPMSAEIRLLDVHEMYNVIFQPVKKQKPNVIIDGETTTARFFLGPRQEMSAEPVENGTINPELLQKKENVPLTITMTCPFCRSRTVYKRNVTYFSDKRISSEAQFSFVPLKQLTASGIGTIFFQITSKGVQYDNLTFRVTVYSLNNNQQFTDQDNSSEISSFSHNPAMIKKSWVRDVDLTITLFAERGHLNIQLQPGTPAVTDLIGNNYLDRDKQPKTFSTGLNIEDARSLVSQAYLELNGIVNNDQDLLKALSGDPNLEPIKSSIILSTKDRDKLLRV